MALIALGLLGGAMVRPGTSSPVQYVDDQVQSWFLAHRSPAWVHALHPMAYVGNVAVVAGLGLVACLVLGMFGLRGRALVPAAAVLGTDVMVYLLKYSVGRRGPRGVIGHGAAFPSGHMSGITALVVPLAVLAWTTRRWWWPAVLALAAMVTMAVALLVLNAHWFSDIVAGAVLTGTWAVAVALWVPDRFGLPGSRSDAERRSPSRRDRRPPVDSDYCW